MKIVGIKSNQKKILIENQLPTPEYIVSSQNMKIDPDTDFLNYQGGFFVKPNCNGSSLGISKIKNKGKLQDAIAFANKFSEEVLIEKAYNDSEYTVGILNGEALEPLQILPDSNRGLISSKSLSLEGIFPRREISLHKVGYRYPFSDQAALRSITLSAAEILGVDEMVGSLEPGKHATFFIAESEPLTQTTNPIKAFRAFGLL